jgi:hypothetical protein
MFMMRRTEYIFKCLIRSAGFTSHSKSLGPGCCIRPAEKDTKTQETNYQSTAYIYHMHSDNSFQEAAADGSIVEVCGLHFETHCIYSTQKLIRMLKFKRL